APVNLRDLLLTKPPEPEAPAKAAPQAKTVMADVKLDIKAEPQAKTVMADIKAEPQAKTVMADVKAEPQAKTVMAEPAAKSDLEIEIETETRANGESKPPPPPDPDPPIVQLAQEAISHVPPELPEIELPVLPGTAQMPVPQAAPLPEPPRNRRILIA